MIIACQVMFWIIVFAIIVGVFTDKVKFHAKRKAQTYPEYLNDLYNATVINIIFLILFAYLIWWK